jgi:hypothetical protein
MKKKWALTLFEVVSALWEQKIIFEETWKSVLFYPLIVIRLLRSIWCEQFKNTLIVINWLLSSVFYDLTRLKHYAVSTVLCKEVTLTFAIPLKLKLDLLVVAVGCLEQAGVAVSLSVCATNWEPFTGAARFQGLAI